ncbi:MAG: tetratricopeptide repeat protein [Limisphaerales bacterium]
MAFYWRRILILLALVLSGGQLFAASIAKENRAYTAAVSAFQDEIWNRAETEFAQFLKNYPDSTRAPQAELLRAEAEFKLGKFDKSIALLNASKTNAGIFADQYVYWIGEAQFQNSNYVAAAANFDSLAKNFQDSSLRLQAVVESASANARLGNWRRLETSLEKTNGIFRRAAQLDSGNELVSRGRLLLAQAKFELKDFRGATAILESINPQALKPELDWRLNDLLYQIKFAAGDLNAALTATTNLLQIAQLENRNDWIAESFALRADALEKLNRTDDAVAAYQENLATNAPVAQQQQAILKIAELSVAQKQFTNAEQSLENFLARFTNSPATGIARLTLGELYLKDFLAQPSATNDLQLAVTNFDQFITAFTNNSLLGKAFLDRGWADWLATNYSASLDDFQMAVKKLPRSEDLAVAEFKLGDAEFAAKDFSGALTNYNAVVDDFSNFPAIGRALDEQAFYQSLRVNLALNNLPGATVALARILKTFPEGDLSDNAIFLVGEFEADTHRPSDARALFQQFEEKYPNSELRPQVELAIARTYEQEQNWPAAIGNYEIWLKKFPANSFQPQANYALAWANFQDGNETNALAEFTNFITRFPTNDLAPQAQWWVAGHFFRAGEFVGAETNYESIFQNTNWQNSPLVYQAQMMAGRAALGRLGYSDAIQYFKNLAADTHCPADLNAQARLAWGSVLMRMDSTDTNNPLANFQVATNVFGQICQLTNEFGALAWGDLGNCYLQLTSYDAATNAYAQVISSPFATISARSQARIGLGIALEKKAGLTAGDGQKSLREMALKSYLDALYENENNLRDGKPADSFWMKKADIQAANAAELLGEWNQAGKLYQRLQNWFPQLKGLLGKKIAAAQEHVSQEKK